MLSDVSVLIVKPGDIGIIPEQYFGNDLVFGYIMILPVSGIVREIPVVSHHEITTLRNFKMERGIYIHRFVQIRLV